MPIATDRVREVCKALLRGEAVGRNEHPTDCVHLRFIGFGTPPVDLLDRIQQLQGIARERSDLDLRVVGGRLGCFIIEVVAIPHGFEIKPDGPGGLEAALALAAKLLRDPPFCKAASDAGFRIVIQEGGGVYDRHVVTAGGDSVASTGLSEVTAGSPSHVPVQRPDAASKKRRPVPKRTHVAIICIRQDEYESIERRLGTIELVRGKNHYKWACLKVEGNLDVNVAVTRVSAGQGNTKAQSVAFNVITDLDPDWLFLVGIAGGVPSPEYGLGDVVLASHLNDFSVSAASEGAEHKYQTYGGPMHREIERLLQVSAVGSDLARLRELAGFDSDPRILNHPIVFPSGVPKTKRFYGTRAFRAAAKAALEARFPDGTRKGGPKVWIGPCASSNTLMKDTGLMEQWRSSARHVSHVEMELAGVYEATRTAGREAYPLLAIRGLSDIVGMSRSPEWTAYAADTAGAFAVALLRSGLIDFGEPR